MFLKKGSSSLLFGILLASAHGLSANQVVGVDYAPTQGDVTLCQINWGVPASLLTVGEHKSGEALRLEGTFKGDPEQQFRFTFFPEYQDETTWFRFDRNRVAGQSEVSLRLFRGKNLLCETNHAFTVPNLKGDAMGHSVQIVPPEGYDIFKGKVKFSATTSGPGIARVRYFLDREEVASSNRKPYGARINLGLTRVFSLRAEALGADDRILARDTLRLNAGPYAFDVQLVTPVIGSSYSSGSLRARAVVRPPLGQKMERLDFFVDETRIASVFDEPFSLPMTAPTSLASIRVVGHVDRHTKDEDSVLINSPASIETMEVRNIDLFITVEDKYKDPVTYLDKKDFTVYENDKEVTIQEFHAGEDRPLHMVFLVDISGSMSQYIPGLVDGSHDLVQNLLGNYDRASLSIFGDTATLLTSFTSNKYRIFQGLNELEREAESASYTAFYDGVVSALYDLSGIEGRRALLIFSDGADNRSRFSKGDVTTFAKQAGVRIYVFHTLPSGSRSHNPWLKRLAMNSGGGYYSIHNASYLKEFFQKIETDIASQYLIRYNSSRQPSDHDCRQIRVEVSEAGLVARTIKEYCP